MTGETRILNIAEGVSVAAPTQTFLKTNSYVSFANDAAFVAAKGVAVENGDTYFNTTDNRVRYYHGGEWIKTKVGTAYENYTDETAFVAAEGTAQKGDVFFNTTLNRVRYYDGTSWVTTKVGTDGIESLGTIVQSMLTETQFQSLNSTSWVLMDGRDVTGSAYATLTGQTTLPDARGAALRMKNNGRSDGNQNPDGDSILGAWQGDEFESHTHGTVNAGTGVTGGGLGYGVQSSGGNTQAAGGNETRMKNVTVNFFIKINN